MAARLAPRVDEYEPNAQHPHSLFQGSAGALAFFCDCLSPETANGAPDFDW